MKKKEFGTLKDFLYYGLNKLDEEVWDDGYLAHYQANGETPLLGTFFRTKKEAIDFFRDMKKDSESC